MKGRLDDTFKDELTATAMKLGTAAFLLTIREAGFKPVFRNLPEMASKELRSHFLGHAREATDALSGEQYAAYPGVRSGGAVIPYLFSQVCECGEQVAEGWIAETDKVMFGSTA